MSKTLVMTFLTQEGKTVSLSVKDPKDNLTKEQINAAMDTIITSNILFTDSGDLIKKDSANIVDRNVNEIAL